MDTEPYDAEGDRELLLTELRGDVYEALKKRDYPTARRHCQAFGTGPDVSRICGLIELTAGNLSEAMVHLDTARRGYLDGTEGGTRDQRRAAWLNIVEIEVASCRAYSQAGYHEDAVRSYEIARKYYDHHYGPLLPAQPEPFGDYYRQQAEALKQQEQDLRPTPNQFD